MDQSNTLHKLLEAADLAKMVEELVAPGNLERLSPASLSGVRITLRHLRETMLSCHDQFVADSSQRTPNRFDSTGLINENPAIVRQSISNEQPRMIKKDLRSSLNQMVERSSNQLTAQVRPLPEA